MWAAHLVDTVTGQLGARLDLLDGGLWSQTVNAGEDAQLTVGKGALLGVDLQRWFMPWDNAVLVTAGGEPLLLGPIIDMPEIDRSTVSFRVGGFLSLLGQRYAVADVRPGGEAELAKSVLAWSGVSLGSIMWRLVQTATGKRGGGLPVVHGSPDETGLAPGGHERTYKGFDVANLQVSHLLDLLSGVIDGPDYAFRARWAGEDRRRVEWVLVHGTQASPRLVQDRMLTIDESAPHGRVTDFRVVGEYKPLSRIVGTGAGTDAGTLLAVAEDPSAWLRSPLLEGVWSDTSNESQDLLVRHAEARLADSEFVTMQVNATVVIDEAMPLTSWHVGEEAVVRLGGRWWPWPAGEHRMTIIKRSGQVGSGLVAVEAQTRLHRSELARAGVTV